MIGRRSVLGGLGAFAALAIPVVGFPAPPLRRIRPPRLRAGDTVGLVTPAGFVADFGPDAADMGEMDMDPSQSDMDNDDGG